MTDPWWAVVSGWVIFGSVGLVCLTFLLTVILTQRHYRAMERLRYSDLAKAKDVEIAELQERQVNGRNADDVIAMAKATERQAKAEEKLALSIERRVEAQAKLAPADRPQLAP